MLQMTVECDENTDSWFFQLTLKKDRKTYEFVNARKTMARKELKPPWKMAVPMDTRAYRARSGKRDHLDLQRCTAVELQYTTYSECSIHVSIRTRLEIRSGITLLV